MYKFGDLIPKELGSLTIRGQGTIHVCSVILFSFFPTEDVLERIMDHRSVLKPNYFYRSIHVIVIPRGVIHLAEVQSHTESVFTCCLGERRLDTIVD